MPGHGHIGRLDLRTWTLKPFPLPELDGAFRELHRLALGPDGNIWYTDRGAGRIGRMDRDGMVTEFALGAGYRPEEIIKSHDGRMLFTLAGKNRIGSILVKLPLSPLGSATGLPFDGIPKPAADGKVGQTAGSLSLEPSAQAEAAGPSEDAADGKAASPGAAPKRRKLTREQRRAREDQWLARARDRYLASLPAEPDQVSWKVAPAEAVADAKESKARHAPAGATQSASDPAGKPHVPGPATKPDRNPPVLAGDPDDLLWDMYVNLSSWTLENHILERHEAGADPDSSQFDAQFSDPEQLKALIAAGLSQAGADARWRVKNAYGRYLTLCSVKGLDQVGRHNRYGRFTRTGKFLVVASRFHSGEADEYDVITAYPVAEDW
jgi:hypothetical protein